MLTSNVDGQFQKAGFAENRICEVHGSIHQLQCLKPCANHTWSAATLSPSVDPEACRWLGELPGCHFCGDLARPNILMFVDAHWQSARYEEQERQLEQWLARVRRPVVVEIGAGIAIPSVRHFSDVVVGRHGGRLVRVNPTEPDVQTPWDVGLRAGAMATLEAIDKVVEFT